MLLDCMLISSRLFAVIVILILFATLSFTWLFPTEKKRQGIYLSVLFISMAIFYLLLPLSTIKKKENFRNHNANMQLTL